MRVIAAVSKLMRSRALRCLLCIRGTRRLHRDPLQQFNYICPAANSVSHHCKNYILMCAIGYFAVDSSLTCILLRIHNNMFVLATTRSATCNNVIKLHTKLEASFFEELEGTAWKKVSITRQHNSSLVATTGMYRVIVSMQKIERRK